MKQKFIVGRVCVFVVIWSFFLPAASGADETVPPRAINIQKKLDVLWKQRAFDEIDRYVADINRKWPSYVPSVIAKATYERRQGAQVESALSTLQALKDTLKGNLQVSSPFFLETLDADITRFTRSAEDYKARGMSPEQRLQIYNPRTMNSEKLSDTWGDQILFNTAPEVILKGKTEESKKVMFHDVSLKRVAFSKESDDSLERLVLDFDADTQSRVLAASTLVYRRNQNGINGLLSSLGKLDMILTGEKSIEAIKIYGASATPSLIKYLTEANNPEAQKMALWALCNFPDSNGEISKAIRKFVDANPNAAINGYALDVCEFLDDQQRSKAALPNINSQIQPKTRIFVPTATPAKVLKDLPSSSSKFSEFAHLTWLLVLIMVGVVCLMFYLSQKENR